jgi:phosphopantothenoylcysteine decarboxylase/phosphopantothenate--cysteine ligase
MRILITAGPTRGYLDPVRFLSNPSTGTFGFLIARAAREKKHTVTVIAGPVSSREREGIPVVHVVSAQEMYQAVMERIPYFDALVMSAAVTDWRPVIHSSEKLKEKKSWSLQLDPNPDILQKTSLQRRNQRMITIGFAVESSDLIENGMKKLKKKDLDLILVNGPENFGENPEKARIYLIWKSGENENCSGFSKKQLADRIVKELERFIALKEKDITK